MIIIKTPFRVSFFGGGTDLKSFYSIEDGCTISTTINKFVYVLVKKQSGIIEKKYKINWKKNEYTNNINKIEHPIIRETLKYFKINYPIEIASFADIPASTGLGSSSAFAVGLVHALLLLEKKKVNKKIISKIASTIEVDILKRSIGKQDHYASCYGGFNRYIFKKDKTVVIKKLQFTYKQIKSLEDNLIMLFTGIKRDAHKILQHQSKSNNQKNYDNFLKLKNFCNKYFDQSSRQNNIKNFGKDLHNYWKLKKKLSVKISNHTIDNYYDIAIKNGAIGGKILGAGGGGFLLFYSRKKNHKKIIHSLSNLSILDFKFTKSGTEIIYKKN